MNYNDLKYLKTIILSSLITGAISAFLSLIPILMPFFVFLFLPFVNVIIVFLISSKKEGFYLDENKKYLIYGAISGAVLSFVYLILFPVLVLFVHLFHKVYYTYAIQYFNLFLFIVFFITIGCVYVSSNAVIGLLYGIIYRYFKGKNNV